MCQRKFAKKHDSGQRNASISTDNTLHMLCIEILKANMSVFQVLWRYTGVLPENAPKNVKVMKWLPQNDLLGTLNLNSVGITAIVHQN